MPPGGQPASRAERRPNLTERHVLALGLGVSGVFVLAAAAAAIWAVANGSSTWAALHLALAGAATVAIGAFMPHFAVTLSGTRPAAPRWRLASLGLLAAGSAIVVAGVTVLGRPWPTLGTALVVAGLVWVAAHVLAPLREPLARRHHVVTAAYIVALVELALGVIIGGLGAAGATLVISSWDLVRPAHAWLTLFGAVSLTITATLVYLAPTVLGARIRAGWELGVAVLGIGIGPPIVAVAFVLDVRAGVLVGILLTLVGAVGQVAYGLDSLRRRGPYTSEHDWRSVAVGHLLVGPVWLAAALVVALTDLLGGRALSGWTLGLLALPVVAGWMLQELAGSWTHLAPSVTPGDPAVHARQRRVLAVAARSRLVAWNAGLAALWMGLATEVMALAAVGGAAFGATLLLSVVLLLRSLAVRAA
jgi:hypothetical protein